MANIKINKKEFEDLIGQEIAKDRLKEEASYLGVHWNPVEGKKWDVETYPNRPDLLSVEGLARAYKGFFDIDTGLEEYKTKKGDTKVHVEDSVENVRPYIGAAVVKDVELTQRAINGLIQLQEKLHETTGRKRDKIAIGLHDMDQIEPPFTYKAVEPEQVSFKPLEYDNELHLEDILNEHDKGQEYSWILEDEDKYPIITDKNGKILSFPPIINNQLTEVTTKTTDIFIDVTGKDKKTVEKIVNIIATALSKRGGLIETVQVEDQRMPLLKPEKMELEVDYVQNVSGLDINGKEIKERLEKMKYGVEKIKKGTITVQIPSYRTDIMHDYDLIEDVVIAHRYSNIDPELPNLDTTGEEKPVETYTNTIREILQGSGALETHTYLLSSKEKMFYNMEKEEEEIASMSNSISEELEVVRSWLTPSLLEILNNNKHREYPQKFFEVGDVVKVEENKQKTVRKLSYVISGNTTNYTSIKEVLQLVERDLGVDLEVEEYEKPFLDDERSARVLKNDIEVGFIGELNEKVLDNWDLTKKTAVLEINVSKLRKLSE